MRILLNNLEETEIQCMECGSTLAYTQKDIHYSDIEICGLIGEEACIYCPVCSNEIIIRTVYHSIR